MSDSSMYEFGSIVWDDFSESDDHKAPYPDGKQVADLKTEGDLCDKLRHEKVAASRKRLNKIPPNKDAILRSVDAKFQALKGRRAPMPEKGSWSHTPKSACPDVKDPDCLKEVTSLASDDVNVSTNCFKDSNVDSLNNDFFMDDAVLDEKDETIDGNLCHFPLDDLFSTGSNIDFFGDECENKKCSYLPYFEWPDIDKFDDLDRMFRGYDSTFGPGNSTNEDELSLFSSSSRDVDRYEDVHKSSFNFSENDTPLVIDTSGEKNTTNTYVVTPWALDSGTSATLSCFSFANSSGSNAEDKIISVCKDQPMERSSDPSPNSTEHAPEEKIEKLHMHHIMPAALSVAPQHEGLVDHAACSSLHQIHDEIGGYCEVEGLKMELSAAELDSSYAQEKSCVSSIMSEEISLKTTSFQQLQMAIEQLDAQTKLCIRDSLYRLARSANRRHNLGTSDNSIRDGGDKSEVTTIEERDRCMVGIETHTNSIDRSIAQLLFHRPSDPANGSVSIQSHAKIHGSTTGQPVLPEEVCRVIASNVDTKLKIIDQNKGSSEPQRQRQKNISV